jgi:hypothetical protein
MLALMRWRTVILWLAVMSITVLLYLAALRLSAILHK